MHHSLFMGRRGNRAEALPRDVDGLVGGAGARSGEKRGQVFPSTYSMDRRSGPPFSTSGHGRRRRVTSRAIRTSLEARPSGCMWSKTGAAGGNETTIWHSEGPQADRPRPSTGRARSPIAIEEGPGRNRPRRWWAPKLGSTTRAGAGPKAGRKTAPPRVRARRGAVPVGVTEASETPHFEQNSAVSATGWSTRDRTSLAIGLSLRTIRLGRPGSDQDRSAGAGRSPREQPATSGSIHSRRGL
jgi:hypothetical protein